MLQLDKQLHFLVGALITALVFIVTNNGIYALFASIVAGAAKEAYDYYTGRGNPELLDFYATVIGAMFSSTIIFIK